MSVEEGWNCEYRGVGMGLGRGNVIERGKCELE